LANNWESARIGSSSYGQQVTAALYCNGSKEEQEESTNFEFAMHLLCIPWKLMCACFAPPPVYLSGWLTFYGALGIIAFQTAIIADLAELVGCCLGIPDMVTAITLVALGTSLPDTFASRTAAIQDEFADSSVTNVTGSNSVNVFLGLGIPWTMGAFYWSSEGRTDEWIKTIFRKRHGAKLICENLEGGLIHYGDELGFSVVTYSCCAFVALAILAWRRKVIGGEFGGPATYKFGTSAVFFMLWCTYIGLSSWYSIQEEDDYEKNHPEYNG
jgi:solute carrier family 8 (sodium/calcium exchanger)